MADARLGKGKRERTSGPGPVDRSTTVLPTEVVTLHIVVKVWPRRFNQRAVVKVIIPQLAVFDERALATPNNDVSVRPRYQIVENRLAEHQRVGRGLVRGGSSRRRRDVRAESAPRNDTPIVHRRYASRVSVSGQDNLSRSYDAAVACVHSPVAVGIGCVRYAGNGRSRLQVGAVLDDAVQQMQHKLVWP